MLVFTAPPTILACPLLFHGTRFSPLRRVRGCDPGLLPRVPWPSVLAAGARCAPASPDAAGRRRAGLGDACVRAGSTAASGPKPGAWPPALLQPSALPAWPLLASLLPGPRVAAHGLYRLLRALVRLPAVHRSTALPVPYLVLLHTRSHVLQASPFGFKVIGQVSVTCWPWQWCLSFG